MWVPVNGLQVNSTTLFIKPNKKGGKHSLQIILEYNFN